ncbi:MAG: Si-specific NAD(P)(+) transhydrogenase [Myxococcaceae bacterium]|nr:Si-specific NAD(P)(+) transhydrogenase [Myxococcaceae bacterium]
MTPALDTTSADFDLMVIGAGPAGQKAALQAAKLGKKVAIVEREPRVGGACVSTGTLPSKTLRETVHLRSLLGRRGLAAPGRATMSQLLERKAHVVKHEVDIIQGQLDRNHVEVIRGEGRFESPHRLKVVTRDGMHRSYQSRFFVIATGSRPVAPKGLALDDARVLDSDSVLDLEQVPRTLVVLGGGVIGCEYACIFAALGTKVTLVDRRDRLLRFMDREITDALAYQMRKADITLRLGEDFEDINLVNGTGRVEVRLRSGKVVLADRLLCAMGRASNVESLGLDALAVSCSATGLVQVNEHYQTTGQPNLYAVGDVIGFPSLASTSMEQGRLAACHAFGEAATTFPQSFPYGIYTIPEMSYVGATEEELTERKVPYEVGRAEYSETARGQILGDHTGLLKLCFHRESLELLGVHIIGEGATELIHIGQAVLAHGGKVTYFRDNVFNYPTLAEAYKIAALNGINRL